MEREKHSSFKPLRSSHRNSTQLWRAGAEFQGSESALQTPVGCTVHACYSVLTAVFNLLEQKPKQDKKETHSRHRRQGFSQTANFSSVSGITVQRRASPQPLALGASVGLHTRSSNESPARLAALPRLPSSAASAPPLAPGPRAAGREKRRGGLF